MKTYSRQLESHVAKQAVLSAVEYLDRKQAERKHNQAEWLLAIFCVLMIVIAFAL